MAGDVPHLVIRPPSRWSPLNLRDVWAYRGLLGRLTIRDLKLRYKQTVLGIAWVVLQPLMAAGVFSFVFGRVADLPSEGVPYFVFSYIGMMVWTAFSQTLMKTSSSLVGNAQLISKVYFPRLVLPLSTVGSTLIDFAVSAAVGLVILLTAGITPEASAITMPLWLALALLLACGLGLMTSSLMVQYRDVGYILPTAIQLLLYATPVAYSLSAVPEDAQWLVQINPMAGVIEGFRSSLIGTTAPSATTVVWSACTSLVLFITGAFMFTRRERGFADVI